MEKWQNCLEYIRERIPEQAFQTWFDDVVIASSIQEEAITLQVPNQFHYEWLESKYRHLIDSAIKEHFNNPMVVNYSVVISNKSTEEIPKLQETEKPIPKGYHQSSQLNSRYIFENFIEGKDNQFAKAAAFSVSDTPGQTPFNPLLIYSNPGLGKTHLLQAIGNHILQKKPSTRVVYLTSEKFMQEFISAIQKNKSTEFAQTYRNVDILLLDDVQFFQKKDQTQEQFFHLFNDLYQRGKQIVLTADRHPNELKGIKDRLVSRFQSGLIVDIQAPDLETRIAILSKQADDDCLDIPYDVTEFIAFSVKNDVRRMKAVLIRLLALSSISHLDITMEMAKKVLVDMLGKSAFNKVNIDHVIKCVSKEMKVSERQMSGKGRKQNVAIARQTAMFLARELTDLSLINIGSHFGGRDHSTVIHACKTIEGKIQSDAEFAHNIENMKSDIS
jgi:chromosomal replication initiator protein